MKNFKFCLILILVTPYGGLCVKDILDTEINYLSCLPLDELVKIKMSLNDMNVEPINKNLSRFWIDENNGGENGDESLESRHIQVNTRDLSSFPILGGVFKKIYNKTSHLFPQRKQKHGGRNSVERSYEHYEEEKHPSKIETIFQVSITGLSFLAFGGYLLCMIVQAIKSKGTTYYHPNTAIAGLTTNQNNSPIKKIKIYKRSKRGIKNDEIEFVTQTPEEMYKILKLFAEGYANITDN